MPTRLRPNPARAARIGSTTAIVLVAIAAGCSGGSAPPDAPLPPSANPAPPGGPPNVAAGRTAVLAPIESAELVVRESSPQQFSIRVASGLPSGCAKFERIDVTRDGYVLNVSVWNTTPSDPNVACTMIYGIAENTAELGSTFARGESYSVRVNGEARLTFIPE